MINNEAPRLDYGRWGVVFDADGVLLDSVPVYYRATCAVLKAHNKTIPEYTDFVVPAPETTIATFWRSRFPGVPEEALWEEFGKHFRPEEIKVFPEIPAILHTLRTQSFYLGVISANRLDMVEPHLKTGGIDHYFHAAYGAMSDKSLGIRKFCREFRIPLSHLLFVTDGPRDIVHGLRAAVYTVGTSCEPSALPKLKDYGAHTCIQCWNDFNSVVSDFKANGRPMAQLS